MGQHCSGSYSGSTHSVWGQAATEHNTSPLGSHRHFSHGDTWRAEKKTVIHTLINSSHTTNSLPLLINFVLSLFLCLSHFLHLLFHCPVSLQPSLKHTHKNTPACLFCETVTSYIHIGRSRLSQLYCQWTPHFSESRVKMHFTIQSADVENSIGIGNKRKMLPIFLVHEQKH